MKENYFDITQEDNTEFPVLLIEMCCIVRESTINLNINNSPPFSDTNKTFGLRNA